MFGAGALFTDYRLCRCFIGANSLDHNPLSNNASITSVVTSMFADATLEKPIGRQGILTS